jgi:hypothetical protein
MGWKLFGAASVAVIVVALVFMFGISRPHVQHVYATDVARSPAEVYDSLASVKLDALSEDFTSLPEGQVSGNPNSSVIWTIFTDVEIAGQLQITITPRSLGKQSHVTAVYAVGKLSRAARAVPGLRDPNILRDLMEKAIEARLTALDPNVSPAAEHRNC